MEETVFLNHSQGSDPISVVARTDLLEPPLELGVEDEPVELKEEAQLSSFIEGVVILDTISPSYLARASVKAVQIVPFTTMSEYVQPRRFDSKVDTNGAFQITAIPGIYRLEIQMKGAIHWAPIFDLKEGETQVYNFYFVGGHKISGRFQFQEHPEASTFMLDVLRQEDGERITTTIVTPDPTGSRPKKGNRDPIPEDMVGEPNHGNFVVNDLPPGKYILRFSMLPMLPGLQEEIYWEHKVDLLNEDLDFGTRYASFEGFEEELERRNLLAVEAMKLDLLPK